MASTLRELSPSSGAFLPEDFVFSQSTLQIYEDCPRRFWLAFVQQLPWPAVEAAPAADHEQHMIWGEEFHRLVQRAEIGLDTSTLTAALDFPLTDWFNAYLEHRPRDLPSEFVEAELVLSVPFALPGRMNAGREPATYRLVAKYDLVAVDKGGPAVILDWKTGRKPGDPAMLNRRLQTAVYPYVLVEASGSLPWGAIAPEQVEMRYWFAAAPQQAVRLPYDARQHAANGDRLQRLIGSILDGRQAADFPLVPDTDYNRHNVCGLCPYRSRCNRGIGAQPADDFAEVDDFTGGPAAAALDFSLADVEEIAF